MRRVKILKLAKKTLTDIERSKLNFFLSIAYGFDFIDSVLKEKGFERGALIGKNTYSLMRDDDEIENAVLSGDYQRMKVLPKQIAKPNSSKPKKYYVPPDAYTSPTALYERWEQEQENKE